MKIPALPASLTFALLASLTFSPSLRAQDATSAPAASVPATTPLDPNAPRFPALREGWADRDAPQNREASARRFLSLLSITDEEMTANRLTRRPALVHVAELAKAHKDVEALDAFGVYFADKLRFPQKTGLSPFDVNPYVRGIDGIGEWPSMAFENAEASLQTANKLMENKVVYNGKDLDIGAPGSVNWYLPYAPGDVIQEKTMVRGLANGMIFNALAHAFVVTGDRKYLDKYIAFMDDWSIRCTFLEAFHPLMVSDGACGTSGDGAILCTRVLAGIASALPPGQPIMPSRVLAQIIRRRMLDGVPLAFAYSKSNTHNWTPSPAGVLAAMLYDEFKFAPIYLRICLRRNIEDNAVTQNLRDGAENQQCPWYNLNYMGVAGALSLLDSRQVIPSWDDRPWLAELGYNLTWRQEIREHLKEHATYLIHVRTPQGEWPIPIRGGDKRQGSIPAFATAPEAFEDPVNRQILDALDRPGDGVRPDYTSEWFPYAGYTIIREGWERNSGYGSLFCSPMPGAYGGFRSRSNNNTFGVASYGQDLIVDDTTGHYMYPSSPLKVDGKEQFFHAGIYKVPEPAGHKVYQVSAWTEPANWRWHASDRLNLTEGVYAGAWVNLDHGTPIIGPYGQDDSKFPGVSRDVATYGITHQRQAIFVRGPRLWIVTDRLAAKGPHDYSQEWFLPTTPASSSAFEPAQIHTDAAVRRIFTDAMEPGDKTHPAKANISFFQFGPPALKYNIKYSPRPIAEGGRTPICNLSRIDVAWKGEGDQQIVSAVMPRAPATGAEGDLKDVREIHAGTAGVGFEATAPDGTLVQYLSSTTAHDALSIGDVHVHAESLLIAGEAGMALGCSDLAVGSEAVAIPSPDFEFTFKGGKVFKFEPIYRPISPVVIGPDQTVFSDHLDITLTSKTPGVQIHYTLDGSDPTPHSPIYTGPFTLTHSAVVKARAYRPEVKENPPTLSGTLATVPSTAMFEKTELDPASTPPRNVAGLDFRYWQDDWRTLWTQLSDLKPQVTGNATGLWDFHLIPADNPALGPKATPRAKYYAVEYSGFLKIPEDGVYTLHAPHEFVWPDTDPGYLLDVYLGNRVDSRSHHISGTERWYPSTRLHAIGDWSVALKKGLQPFKVIFVDYRTDAPSRLNVPGVNDYIWSGSSPDLEISGPGLAKQPIPSEWMVH